MKRDRSQGILGFLGLVVVCSALGYGAWIVLTRPKSRAGNAPAQKVYTGPDSVGFVAVAAEGVELEMTGPGGNHTSTAAGASADRKIPGSETTVDCPGFAGAGAGTGDASCTTSINVDTPAPGDYAILVRSQAQKAVVLNVGWATASQARRGAFDVRVQVARGGASTFGIIVTREGVSQRSEPRATAP